MYGLFQAAVPRNRDRDREGEREMKVAIFFFLLAIGLWMFYAAGYSFGYLRGQEFAVKTRWANLPDCKENGK